MITHQQAIQQAYAALGAAISGDTEIVNTLFAELDEQIGSERMYDVHSGIAHAGEHLLYRIYQEQAPNVAAGGIWTVELLRPQAVDEEPHAMYAIRFLVAYANRDHATCIALFRAAESHGRDHVAACTWQLVSDIATLARSVLDRTDPQAD
ncbi:hypothetical protein ACFU6S_06405 [Streptomyces sp. NPDC057456]|uniref:hypothetical protein n=1 Tax=Streptomyces sp. NPDC057456 TaxID=3346139 RepID=UPI00367743A8